MADQNRITALHALNNTWSWDDGLSMEFCWGEYEYAGIPFWAPTAIVTRDEADGPIYFGLFGDTAPDVRPGIYPGGENLWDGADLLEDEMLRDFLDVVGRQLEEHTTRFDGCGPRVPRLSVTPDVTAAGYSSRSWMDTAP